jgi:uncharacterized membrane protein YdbT with pleckstrin-like domain
MGNAVEANAGPAVVANADLLPANLLSGDEIVILVLKPSLWFVLFRSFRWLAAMALVVWFIGYFGHLVPMAKNSTVINVVVAVAAARVGFAMLDWAARSYVLTNRRVMRVRGVFNVDLFECQLTKVQNTYLTLTWYERMFGLGSITFTTAGTAGTDPSWVNISRPLEVHEHVRAAINKAQRPNANGV